MYQRRGLGVETPRRWANFGKNYFKVTESHFASVSSHLKELDFQHLKAIEKN